MNTVAKAMHEAAIAAKAMRKFRQSIDSDHGLAVAGNILDREFTPREPNALWLADVTYAPKRDGGCTCR